MVELNQCIAHFEASGYNTSKLVELKEKAINNASTINTRSVESDTLVFPVHFFDGVNEFKLLVKSLNTEISQLIGETRILFALKEAPPGMA